MKSNAFKKPLLEARLYKRFLLVTKLTTIIIILSLLQVSAKTRAQAGQMASEDCSPSPDGRGPVDYKRHLAGVLTTRALRRATARALQQEA